MDMSLSKLLEIVKDREAWYATVKRSQRIRHDLVTEHHHHHEKIITISLVNILHLM